MPRPRPWPARVSVFLPVRPAHLADASSGPWSRQKVEGGGGKRFLLLDSEPYRYQRTLSDAAGLAMKPEKKPRGELQP